MRRAYGKIKAAILAACFFSIAAAVGCSAEEETGQGRISEEIYQMGSQNVEVQIDLSDDFQCTEQSADEVVLDGDAGEIRIEYIEGEGISSDRFPESETDLILMYEDIIGSSSYQVEEFQSYENEGLYYATIRYDLENEVKYLIASGKFGASYGCTISAVLNTGNRETAEEIKDAVYNVKVFTE